MRWAVILALVAFALAGCGKVADLEPAAGHALPQKPLLAAKTPTSDDLLQLPPYAKPDRVDELLRKGEKRKPDRFDLPPPSGAAAPAINPDSAPSTTDTDSQPQPEGNTL